jgi:glucose-1-phosphate adenylyltransferase
LSDWQVRTNLDHEAIKDRGPALICSQGSIENSRIYNGVRVEGKVVRSILFPGVHIGIDAEVKDSIIFFDTQIGPGARVENIISDIGVSIGRDSVIGKKGDSLTLIGIRTQIPQGIRIGPGCIVHPELKSENFIHQVYEKGEFITAGK